MPTLTATALYERGARLRPRAWAPHPLRRREIAGDLPAALLRRLASDGLTGAGKGDGGG